MERELKEYLFDALSDGDKTTMDEKVKDAFVERLEGEGNVVLDADNDKGPTPPKGSLQKHDEVKHPEGFDPETDTCKFREKIMEGGKELEETEMLVKDRGGKRKETEAKLKQKLSGVIGIAAKGEQTESPKKIEGLSNKAEKKFREGLTKKHPEGPLDNPYSKRWGIRREALEKPSQDNSPPGKEKLSDVLNRLTGAEDRPAADESVKTALFNSLTSDERDVLDSIDGIKKRGRPKKVAGAEEDVCRAKDPAKCWKHGFGRDILNEQRKERARKMDRINPRPTRDLDKEIDLEKDLREVGWDLEDVPDDKNETKNMLNDLNNLRKEAGMKKLDETFEPYALYRQKWKEYEETKKEAGQLLKTAEVALKRHRLDMAEEMLGTLKAKPDEIKAKYQEILDSYDGLCDSLCSIMESNGSSDKSKDPNALEVEKTGYGMMFGEDCKGWQKRMRSLGRTKEVPETIKKIDEIVAQTERRWRSVAGITKDDFEIVKENFRKTFSNLMRRCSLASNVTIGALNGVLEDHLKSQHDLTKKGKRFDDDNFSHNAIIGGNEEMPRYRFTRKCFGTERGLKESKYEKYGCLHLMRPDKEDNMMGSQYGRNIIRWKPHKTVATMTFTDSLCLAREGLNYVNPCLVTNPSPCCFNPENQDMVDALKRKPVNIGLNSMCDWADTPYVELQLHGEDQYDAEAIESISFGSADDVKNLSKAAVQKILNNHIELYLGDKPIEIDERGRIKTGK